MESFCDSCEKLTSRKELGRKVRGEYLCKKCKIKKREAHREKTIEGAGIKDDLRELKNKEARESRSRNKKSNRKPGRPPKDYGSEGAPIPKGSKLLTKKKQTSCYLTFQERQALFRILIKRGVDNKEAKERIQELVDSQRDLRKKLEEKDESEEEIKSEQRKLLEELWEN